MAERSIEPPARKAGQKKHFVLVVDADPGSVFLLSVLLVRLHYDFITAASAEEAFEKAKLKPLSCVITALDLPDMNGVSFIQRLKQNTTTSHIPLISVARQEYPDLKNSCLEHGAVGYLCLPIEAETLYHALQSAIEKNPRAHMRLRTVQAVKVYGNAHDSLYGAYTLALSEGGMFLRTMSPVSVKTRMSLEFNLVGRTIAAEAEVLYNCQTGCEPDMEKGIGLRFIEIGKRDREFIRKFIRKDIMKGIFPGNKEIVERDH